MTVRLTIGALLAIALAGLGVSSGTVLAEYPGPNGSVLAAVSDTTAAPGATVTVSATVRDENNNPVANAACTMSVGAQPGSGATVTQNSAQTDANGAISGTLDVGSAAGTVVVNVVCPAAQGSGEVLSASASVVVDGAVAPSASLPGTGAGSPEESGGAPTLVTVALVLGGALLVLGGARRFARRRAGHG